MSQAGHVDPIGFIGFAVFHAIQEMNLVFVFDDFHVGIDQFG